MKSCPCEGFKASQLFFKAHGNGEIELVHKDLNPAHGGITEYMAKSIAVAGCVATLSLATQSAAGLPEARTSSVLEMFANS